MRKLLAISILTTLVGNVWGQAGIKHLPPQIFFNTNAFFNILEGYPPYNEKGNLKSVVEKDYEISIENGLKQKKLTKTFTYNFDINGDVVEFISMMENKHKMLFSYEFDDKKRLLQIIDTIDGYERKEKFVYDSQNRVIEADWNLNDIKLMFTYQKGNLLESVKYYENGKFSYALNYKYNLTGYTISQMASNRSVSATYVYQKDKLIKITGIKDKTPYTYYEFKYDLTGNILELIEDSPKSNGKVKHVYKYTQFDNKGSWTQRNFNDSYFGDKYYMSDVSGVTTREITYNN